MQTRDLAQDHLSHFAHDARALARPVLRQAMGTRDSAQDHLAEFAQQARAIAEPALHEAVDYARHEGAIVARAAARQAVAPAAPSKPIRYRRLSGVVAVALLANLLLGRKRT